MKSNSFGNNRVLLMFVIVFWLFGIGYCIDSGGSYRDLIYNFDRYEYSYDEVQWRYISKEELSEKVFTPEESLFIRASVRADGYNTSIEKYAVQVETNEVGTAISTGDGIITNDLYKGSIHSGEFTYGNTPVIKTISLDNTPELYKNGVTFEFIPYDENNRVIVYMLTINEENSTGVLLGEVAYNRVILGVFLLGFGSIFLLTLSAAMRNEKSLAYRYYVIGYVSFAMGIFVLFLSNYYFTEQNQNYLTIIKISFVLTYSTLISFASVLYDTLNENYPQKRSEFKIILTSAVVIVVGLIWNMYAQVVNNRYANAFFTITAYTYIFASYCEVAWGCYRDFVRKRPINFTGLLIKLTYISAFAVIIKGIDVVFLNRFSITVDLIYFKVFLLFNMVWLLLYTIETRVLTTNSRRMKEKAEKTNALLNVLLDMNQQLVNLEKSDIRVALKESIAIANKYMPDLIFWESLILDLDLPKYKRLNNEQRFNLESCLSYALVCTDIVLNNDVVEIDTKKGYIVVGASDNLRLYIDEALDEESDTVEKIKGELELEPGDYIIKSKIPKFQGVFLCMRGLENFSPTHREKVIKNLNLVFESAENVLIQNEIRRNQRQIIYDLTTISETKSKETYNHVKRVVSYTKLLAQGLGFSEEETELISIASAMHDLGKIVTPYEILHKNGRLTEEEFKEIQKHTNAGYEILKVNEGEIFNAAAIIAREHHEKYNGKGYMGKKGEEIHVYARIVSVADVFDALASDRAYKAAWPLDKVMNLIISEAGEHFDPKVVDVFIDKFNEFLEIKRMYVD